MTNALRLLLIEDNAVDREGLRRMLGPDYEIADADTARGGMDLCRTRRPDCILLDYRLPDADGTEVLDQLRPMGVATVMLTGQGNERIAVEALKRGAEDYLVKGGLTREALRRAISNAVERVQLRRRIARQQEELEDRLRELEEQRRALEDKNEALRRSEERIRMLLRQLPAVLWTTDESLRLTSLTGRLPPEGTPSLEELLGSRVDAVGFEPRGEPTPAEAHAAALEGRSTRFDFVWADRVFQGSAEALSDASGERVGVVGVAMDVTEHRHLEEQVRHAQKLDAMGQLAGGIAHDFNNLLTAVKSFAEFASKGLDSAHPVQSDLRHILQAAGSAERLTRKLLAFSRREPMHPVVVDVREAVESVERILRRLVPEDIELCMDVDADAWRVRVDGAALEQVLLNMALNARDAMPDGGRLTVEASNQTLDAAWTDALGEHVPEGDYVMLSIGDTGVGMAPEVQDRVFEPFFTTKEAGKGTGLGLATCYGIVRQAEGFLRVYSEPGRGSIFRIYLPRAHGEAEAPPARPVEEAHGGHETVLVAEDEPQVRHLAVRALRTFGYDVLEACDGQEALERLDAHPGRVDLVLSDVVMPRLGGPELAEALHARASPPRILFMSGYTAGSLEQRGTVESRVQLLQKPFALRDLREKVREILDESDVDA
ncbi:MAG: response regulator [Myxococcota bacterium]